VSGLIVDPFAGPGGWSEGLRMLGLSDIGIEWDAAACATRAAAGHLTIRADVATYPPERFAGAEGAIFSPPCPDFSVAGKRAGRAGTSGHLIDTVPVWVEAIRPRWVACEQVPPCLPIWQEHAARYRQLGYSTWCGILNAADYGAGQTRRRAFLLASLDRVAQPPVPTHTFGPGPTLFGSLSPWLTMARALCWPEAGTSWPYRMPATTVAGDPRITARCHHDEGSQGANAKSTDQVRDGDYEGTEPIRLTLAEALTLQSFPPDYPVQGTKTERFTQVGNAVPPLLAAHVIAAVTGRAIDEEEAA
jgi:DNA (cytosine-5)-methyltransferase 1